MNNEKKTESAQVGRRTLVRRAVYVVPAVLAAVKASERPAYAQGSFFPTPAGLPIPISPPV